MFRPALVKVIIHTVAFWNCSVVRVVYGVLNSATSPPCQWMFISMSYAKLEGRGCCISERRTESTEHLELTVSHTLKSEHFQYWPLTEAEAMLLDCATNPSTATQRPTCSQPIFFPRRELLQTKSTAREKGEKNTVYSPKHTWGCIVTNIYLMCYIKCGEGGKVRKLDMQHNDSN